MPPTAVPVWERADNAVLPPSGSGMTSRLEAFHRVHLAAEWLREADRQPGTAGAYGAAAQGGLAAITPAHAALSLFPGVGHLPPPPVAPTMPPPMRLEVTVKAGQEFSAEVSRIADERIELVVLPALNRANAVM